MKKLFGTDGMRGAAGVFPLDEKTIEALGFSLASQFKAQLNRQPKFITGRDTRESGAWIEQAFCRGAAAAGATCESAGIITTPGVAYLTKSLRFDAGIVISASHNPFADNGIKIFLPNGKKIDETIERNIERDIHENKETHISAARAGNVSAGRVFEYQESYLNYLADEFSDLWLDNFKMVVDCANGAASSLAPRLFKKFGAEVIAIHHEPDGRNINENCGSLHLENLQSRVLEEKADFGVAFDGDADRALFVDEQGNLVDGDATLWALANHLKAHGKLNGNAVVATVMSNIGLEIALRSRSIELKRTAVGDKYVLDELLKSGSSIGGEQSGHIILPERSLIGDGMLTALFLLEAMRENQKTLSQITEGFQKLPQTLLNVKVREKIPFDDVSEIAAAAKETEAELGTTGRLLLRYSGTENLARVMIEGANQTEIEKQANRLAEVIRARLG